MKRLTLICKCGNYKTFHGKTVDEIINAIDKSGWHDGPDRDWCPECWEKSLDEEDE
jgi:hypothetical protein